MLSYFFPLFELLLSRDDCRRTSKKTAKRNKRHTERPITSATNSGLSGSRNGKGIRARKSTMIPKLNISRPKFGCIVGSYFLSNTYFNF
jgi:hypothetical protein